MQNDKVWRDQDPWWGRAVQEIAPVSCYRWARSHGARRPQALRYTQGNEWESKQAAFGYSPNMERTILRYSKKGLWITFTGLWAFYQVWPVLMHDSVMVWMCSVPYRLIWLNKVFFTDVPISHVIPSKSYSTAFLPVHGLSFFPPTLLWFSQGCESRDINKITHL